ncbi:hypothetical protein SDC9_129348 [bioreactor metagenome]|uniref:Uncharacterized protein n=1 Tax=bioreactor metagenome TaxID=1076179 RepID=A0A645CZD4_9ZZZZ
MTQQFFETIIIFNQWIDPERICEWFDDQCIGRLTFLKRFRSRAFCGQRCSEGCCQDRIVHLHQRRQGIILHNPVDSVDRFFELIHAIWSRVT